MFSSLFVFAKTLQDSQICLLFGFFSLFFPSHASKLSIYRMSLPYITIKHCIWRLYSQPEQVASSILFRNTYEGAETLIKCKSHWQLAKKTKGLQAFCTVGYSQLHETARLKRAQKSWEHNQQLHDGDLQFPMTRAHSQTWGWPDPQSPAF